MSDFFKKYDIITRIIAITAALILWVWVMEVKNPITSTTYRDVVVDLTSENLMQSNHSLIVISGEFPKVDITIEGTRDKVTGTSSDLIKAEASLANITEPGEYDLEYTVKLPYIDLEVLKQNPRTVSVVIDEVIVKNIPIIVEYEGTPAAGYVFEPMELEEKLTLTGPKTELEKIDYAYAYVDVDGLNQDISGTYDVFIYDENGAVNNSSYISRSRTTVDINQEILRTKVVPVEVMLKYGDIVSYKAIDGYEITPNNITIIGTPSAVAGISSINLGEINVDATANGTTEFIFIPPFKDNISYYDMTQEFTVNVLVNDYSSKEFVITEFEQPALGEHFDKTVEILTKELVVRVYGSLAELETLTSEHILVRPIFDEDTITVGENLVDCVVSVESELDFDILDEYQITMDVK